MMKPTTESRSPQSGAVDQSPVAPSVSATPEQPQPIAGVVGVAPGKVSPEEKARAKQMLNALQQVRDRSPVSDAPMDLQSEEHLAAAASDIGRKRVKLDDILAPALAEAGYKKVANLTYRASWSTDDVEQFLSLRTFGNPKQYLSGDAGLRNMKAEAFAEQCVLRYANKAYFQCMPKGGYVYPPYFCPMHFSIGSLFGWGIRNRLDMGDLSPDELAHAVVEPIQSKLIHFIGGVTSVERLHDLLESDREPLRWYMRGPYYRAALVAYLARRLGVSEDKTKASLLTHARWMENGIDMTRLTAESYIDHILDDAAVAVAQTAT